MKFIISKVQASSFWAYLMWSTIMGVFLYSFGQHSQIFRISYYMATCDPIYKQAGYSNRKRGSGSSIDSSVKGPTYIYKGPKERGLGHGCRSLFVICLCSTCITYHKQAYTMFVILMGWWRNGKISCVYRAQSQV